MADTPTNGDDVIFGTDEDDFINSLAGNDLVFGGFGSDTLFGSNDNDQLAGGAGIDYLIGGSGSDTAFYGFISLAVTANLGLGYGYVQADGLAADKDNFSSIENLSGGSAGDTLHGNSRGNRIDGNGGDDQIFSGDGNDTANGGSGDDFIRGGDGADTMTGGSGIDRLDYLDADSGVVIDLQTNTTGGGAAGDTISGFEDLVGSPHDDTLRGSGVANLIQSGAGDDNLIGRGGDDWLRGLADDDDLDGGDGDDKLEGGDGNDSLDGEAGADKLYGGANDDIYFIDNTGDRVFEDLGKGVDDVRSSINYTLAAGIEAETLQARSPGSSGALSLTGNEFGQLVKGTAGTNVLTGRGGGDTLTGLGGTDFYVFDTTLGAGNIDEITDYVVADDTIRLDDQDFGGQPLGALAAEAFRANSTGLATEADDRIIYNTATGALVFDSNGNASGGAQQFATLDAGLAMSAADFVVI